MATENEIKLALPPDLHPIRQTLRKLGFRVKKKRVHEMNVVFDTSDLSLRRQGRLIRLRNIGETTLLTYKGPQAPGRHKQREELESDIEDGESFEKVLSRLGYDPVFRYEKFRTEYQKPEQRGVITLDETPIGNFLEAEGPPAWIDRTAKALGFSTGDYITKSYGVLYNDYCAALGITPTNMVFPVGQKPDRSAKNKP